MRKSTSHLSENAEFSPRDSAEGVPPEGVPKRNTSDIRRIENVKWGFRVENLLKNLDGEKHKEV